MSYPEDRCRHCGGYIMQTGPAMVLGSAHPQHDETVSIVPHRCQNCGRDGGYNVKSRLGKALLARGRA